ncbi:MAG: hypothetical protein AAB489_02825 [Patescibacteria group bacterium]
MKALASVDRQIIAGEGSPQGAIRRTLEDAKTAFLKTAQSYFRCPHFGQLPLRSNEFAVTIMGDGSSTLDMRLFERKDNANLDVSFYAPYRRPFELHSVKVGGHLLSLDERIAMEDDIVRLLDQATTIVQTALDQRSAQIRTEMSVLLSRAPERNKVSSA